jgi:hypothetical protein
VGGTAYVAALIVIHLLAPRLERVSLASAEQARVRD